MKQPEAQVMMEHVRRLLGRHYELVYDYAGQNKPSFWIRELVNDTTKPKLRGKNQQRWVPADGTEYGTRHLTPERAIADLLYLGCPMPPVGTHSVNRPE